MSFWIPARELSITWGDDPEHWNWNYLESCRSEVAVLENVSYTDISGKINIRSLRQKTSYAAFLVFKLQDRSSGLQKATASVRFVKETCKGSKHEGYTVFIDTKNCNAERGRFPHKRRDGWMEIKLGEFFNNLGDDGEVEMLLFGKDEHDLDQAGLAVRGIDIRPN